VLSPRSQARSGDLASCFQTARVASTNQEVLDQSDVVVLCVLPHQAEEVLGQLTFRVNQPVVSVMAGVHLSVMGNLVTPARNIARSIPAPAVATRSSIAPIYPATDAGRELYDRLGGYLKIDDEVACESVSAASVTVEAYFHYLGAVAGWLSAHGIAAEDARRYVAATVSELPEEMNTQDVDSVRWLARTRPKAA
jgi:pyrroline-5-carboxylate reductase